MKYKKLSEHIETSWQELTIHTPEDSETHYGLPHPFVAPSVDRVEGFVFREQFYWDSYFTIVGLLGTEHHDLGTGMVHNLLYLMNKLGYVPNSNNRVHQGRSQPPLLSTMVRLVYDHNQDKGWLDSTHELVSREYFDVWLNTAHPFEHNVFRGLSRYYHENRSHQGAEDESGWDYTPRFEDRALDVLPIDLNSFLYIYETDLAYFAEELGRQSQADDWRRKAEERLKVMNELLWDSEQGMFFEYDYVNNARLPGWSLAAFIPLFAGVPTFEQAEQLLDKLKYFETDYGLSTTAKDHEAIYGKQWAAPNGWAPLHYMIVQGLERYGHHDWARQIAVKWVVTVNEKFNQTGLTYEKYNVVDPSKPPTSAVYPDQYGFAWTNSVTSYFIRKYS